MKGIHENQSKAETLLPVTSSEYITELRRDVNTVNTHENKREKGCDIE